MSLGAAFISARDSKSNSTSAADEPETARTEAAARTVQVQTVDKFMIESLDSDLKRIISFLPWKVF